MAQSTGEQVAGAARTSKLSGQNDFTSDVTGDGVEAAITTVDAFDTLFKVDISHLWQGTFELANTGSNSLTYEIYLTKQFKSSLPEDSDTFWTTSLSDNSIWRPYVTSTTLAGGALSSEHLWIGDYNYAAIQVKSTSSGQSTTVIIRHKGRR